MKRFGVLLFSMVLLGAGLSACRRRGTAATCIQKTFLMSTQAEVRAYGPDCSVVKPVADEIFAEWKRISEEYAVQEPFSVTNTVNKKAAQDWVQVDDEFLYLLRLGLDYYKLTEGSFDVTFAPLWPLWKEAAARKQLPAREDIRRALALVGSDNIRIDEARKAVRFVKPVEINIGGLLRPYAFERGVKILKSHSPAYPVQLRLGGNMLAYGDRQWQYRVYDQGRGGKLFGRFLFRKGVVMASSGRDIFVEINGKRYSHLLDLKTGYPLEDFSNLIAYFPDIETGDSMASAALAVMGREKAFKLLGGIKGAAAVWVDSAGVPHVLEGKAGDARWEENKGALAAMLE